MTEITSRLSTALADRYRIERRLGEGGMATVYLAEDLKHKRKVALKVLKPDLAAVLGAERFLQEITTTASLQHPHILPLFDSGKAIVPPLHTVERGTGGEVFLYYVMPFIEGETLRDKLNRETQLGIDEAVSITTAIADALDYAHRQNVIHRDIKPENILLHDGRPMVADFGIALAVSAAAAGRMTETGLSLGSPHYMSPEQATAEKDLTNRSDIYSLGSVLYEMLTGEPPHTGSSAQQIIMKIVTDEARPITDLRKSVPAHVAAATAKALEKLAADRFESAAKFAEALTNPTFSIAAMPRTPVAAIPTGRGNRLTVTLAALAFAFLVAAVWGWTRQSPKPVIRYGTALPEASVLQWVTGSQVALSPDGAHLVYVASDDQGGRLMVRRRNQLEATPLPSTNGASSPFFSPDGKYVGFFAGVSPITIKAIPLAGGPAVTVTDSGIRSIGASWGPDGFLYVDGPRVMGQGLVRVSEQGGIPEVVTMLDTTRNEANHFWPDVLPNAKGVLFTVHYVQGHDPDVAVADIATGEHRVLTRGVFARFAPTGHIVYVTANGILMAQPFDQDRMELNGEAWKVGEGVRVKTNGAADLAMSSVGSLLYVKGRAGDEPVDVVQVARDGTVEEIDPGWTGNFSSLALSPDGSRLAVTVNSGGAEDLWVKQLDQGPFTRLTFEGFQNRRPRWTPDGASVTFISDRAGQRAVYTKRADGSGSAELDVDAATTIEEAFWSADGQWLVYGRGVGTGARDIYGVQLGEASEPTALVAAAHDEKAAALSPDGHWLAYESDESGRDEVYVRPFPNTSDSKWQVSTSGGVEPLWSRSGEELFYRNGNNEMTAVRIVPGSAFVMGEVQTLFSTQSFVRNLNYRAYDVTADGKWFIMIRLRGSAGTAELLVVENFFEELKTKVGN